MQAATKLPTKTAKSLQEAGASLRAHEYSAVVLDQLLVDADPDESERIVQHLGSAMPLYVNFALCGLERLVRETRTALARREREDRVARSAAQQALSSELKESITAMLLSCDLALAVPGVPTSAVEKIRSVHDLACGIREHFASTE